MEKGEQTASLGCAKAIIRALETIQKKVYNKGTIRKGEKKNMPVLWTFELLLDWAKKNGKEVTKENCGTLMEEWLKENNKPFEENEEV